MRAESILPAKCHAIKTYEHLTKNNAPTRALHPTDFALIFFFYRLFNYRHHLTSPEQLWQPKALKTCFGYFQDRFPTMGDNFSGNVNQSSAHRAGIGTDSNDRCTDIFLKGFKQKMTDQHRIIPRGVGIKLFERELFMAKILQSPVGQFITSTFMITGNQSTGRHIISCSGIFKKPVDSLALANVGDNDRIRSATWQIKLVAIVMHQTAINRPSKTLPVPLPATKFGILPGLLFRGFKSFPSVFIPVGGNRLDIFIHLATADITDLKGFTKVENLLVEKTTVHANDDWHVPTIVSFDFDDHMPDHIQHAVAMIGMLVSTAEHGIDDQSAPVHLKGLESLFLFVGWFNAMPLKGIVIIHDHRINTQFDDIGLDEPQAPKKKGLQQPAEQKHPRPGKSLEESFDLMRRSHVFQIRLDASGISAILGKLVEIGQTAAGAIDKKTQHLLEKFCDRQAFTILTDRTKPAIKLIENLNAVQICNEQGQARSAGQPVGSRFDTPNFKFILPVVFAMLAHRVLYLLGVFILVVNLAVFNKYYNTLSNFKGLFFCRNRLL